MENFHRLLELFMDSSHPGWENILLSWRFITRSPICGVDLVNYAANQWPRSRLSLWSFVFWPWKRCFWLGFENDRGSCFALGAEVVANFSLSVIWILYVKPIKWLKMDMNFLQRGSWSLCFPCPIIVESLTMQVPWWVWTKHIWCVLFRFYSLQRWQPTPVLLPGQSHGRRSLVGCGPWGR